MNEELVAYVEGHIHTDKGASSMLDGALVLTDRRVAFIASRRTYETFEQFGLEDIASIKHRSNLAGLLESLTLVSPAGGIHFYMVDKKPRKQWFLKELDERREAARSRGAAPNLSSSQESALEKLEKLNELREAGAISDEEFEAKKHELLDQI